MKLFGYTDEGEPSQRIAPSRLVEVSLVASSAELRSIARFLAAVADSMDHMGNAYHHLHLSDLHKEFETSPQLIVFRADASKAA
jgi:hypothetical protein